MYVLEKQANGVDTHGNPVWATVSDLNYLWNGNTLAEERNGNGGWNVIKRFFAEGEQINGTNYYYSRDHLGSVREMTDSTGTVQAQYDYDPYGVRTKISGNLDADFGFTGHYFHQPSGLNLSMYRAYSPNLGRWISRDPLGEESGVNLYAYVLNDPINAFDPDGRDIYYANHEVAGGRYHSKLIIVPINQGRYWGDPRFKLGPDGKLFATIGAGPDDPGYPFVPSYLHAGFDRPSDLSEPQCNKQKLELPSQYPNEDAAIDALANLLHNYEFGSSKPQYTLLPNSLFEYNSNSFLHGYLNAAGFAAPINTGANTPGYNNPLPLFYFH